MSLHISPWLAAFLFVGSFPIGLSAFVFFPWRILAKFIQR